MLIDLIPILLMVVLVPGTYFFIIYGQKRHIMPLAKTLHGHFPLMSSTLIFDYKGQAFYLMRVSSGRFSSLCLWTQVEERGPWVMGHKDSKKYFRAPFWTLPTYEVEGGIVACSNETICESLKQRFSLGRSLFEKSFQHLTLRSEWHLSRGLIKVNIMRYTGLSEEVNSGGNEIFSVLDDLLKIIQFQKGFR